MGLLKKMVAKNKKVKLMVEPSERINLETSFEENDLETENSDKVSSIEAKKVQMVITPSERINLEENFEENDLEEDDENLYDDIDEDIDDDLDLEDDVL